MYYILTDIDNKIKGLEIKEGLNDTSEKYVIFGKSNVYNFIKDNTGYIWEVELPDNQYLIKKEVFEIYNVKSIIAVNQYTVLDWVIRNSYEPNEKELANYEYMKLLDCYNIMKIVNSVCPELFDYIH